MHPDTIIKEVALLEPGTIPGQRTEIVECDWCYQDDTVDVAADPMTGRVRDMYCVTDANRFECILCANCLEDFLYAFLADGAGAMNT